MKGVSPVFIAALLFLTLPCGAEAPASAPAAPLPKPNLEVHSQLPPGLERHAIAAHFDETTAHFWGCFGPCAPGGEHALLVDIPEEARGKKRRIEKIGTKDDPVLWVRWGSDDEFYSVILIGAKTTMKSAARPRLVLKGWAGKHSKSRAMLEEGEDGVLTLASAPEEAFCGRKLPGRTRVLRAAEGRFATVRAPALSLDERRGARTIQGSPVEQLTSTLVGLSTVKENSSTIPVDADRSSPWQGGYEWVELKLPAEGKLPLVFEFAKPLKDPTALYAVLGTQVYQVEFAPHPSKLYRVDWGAEDVSCVALVQPHTPAPLTEVMVTSDDAGLETTEQLVTALESSDPGLAPAALRVRGIEAGQALSARFSRMSPLARARAFDIARSLPNGAGLPVFVSAVEVGSAREEETSEALRLAGRDGLNALFARLREADEAGASRLIVELTNLDPTYVAEKFPPLLDDPRPERRGKVRAALLHVSKKKAGREALARWFNEPTPAALSESARVELVRALGPEFERVEGGLATLVSLARSADFRDAYLLTPQVVASFDEDPTFKVALSRWIRGDATGKLSSRKRAALSVRVLDSLLEGGDDEARRALGPDLIEALDAQNMRVRRAALLNLARSGSEVPLSVDEVLDLLTGDDWPQVRAAAALAVVPVSAGKLSGRTERVVLRRLHKDDDPSVRRALARSLSDASGHLVIEAVRRSFERDEDFSVRAEAAVTLGKLCDEESLEALTAHARRLGMGLTDEGAIELGLSSVTALAYLAPADINKRLEPLLSEKAPRVTRAQVTRRIEAVRSSRDRAICVH